MIHRVSPAVRLALLIAAVLLAFAGAAEAASILAAPNRPSGETRRFVKVEAAAILLEHVEIIDGLGGPPRSDMSLLIRDGRIAAIAPRIAPPVGSLVLDLRGHAVFPGLIGMHDHLFFVVRPNLDAAGHSDAPLLTPQMSFSAPRLYLAGGVTTIRTAGSVEPYADINLKRLIDAGALPGPHMDVSGPYLEGPGGDFVQMPVLNDPEAVRRTVAFWADQGATSFKAYAHLPLAELKAAIDEAHRHGLKVTAHLCAVTYPEAIALGIDNIEHGFVHDTERDPGKAPGVCTPGVGKPTARALDPAGPEAQALIRNLVDHHVALTSTLPVSELNWPGHVRLEPRVMDAMAPAAREAYLYQRNRLANQRPEVIDGDVQAIMRDMALQRAFVAAGGLLMAGLDPTGNGGVIPGFGDQRGVELLTEAGFTPSEAIRIASYNAAVYLGLTDEIGSLQVGRRADIVVVKGDPAADVHNIENVEIVFKDGVGFDPKELLASVRGRYGAY